MSRLLARMFRRPRGSHEGSIHCDNGYNWARPDKRTWICKPCRRSARRSLIPLGAEFRASKRRGAGRREAAMRDRTPPLCPKCGKPMKLVPWRARLRRRWWRFKVPWR
jgi:hypothetical protein